MGDWDPGSLRAGFCLGLSLPFAAFVLRWVWGKVKSPFRAQTVVQTTKKTPWQVFLDALDAAATALLLVVVLVILAAAWPEWVSELKALLVQLVSF